jgi:LysM repeat protein
LPGGVHPPECSACSAGTGYAQGDLREKPEAPGMKFTSKNCARNARAIVVLLLMVGVAGCIPEYEGEERVHVVEAGDTIASIADQYGVSVEALLAANPDVDPDDPQPGQRLEIPDEPGRVHVVEEGDTFLSISEAYGISVDALIEANPDADPEDLRVEQRLQIPEEPEDTYVIREGDTLFLIAQQYDVSVDDIMAANPGITDHRDVQVGRRLVIPNGQRAEETGRN